jgi:hypothetical protein
VQNNPSSAHAAPAGSKQLSAASLQIALHSVPGQGSPEDTQAPNPSQLSAPVQNNPSSAQGMPAGSKQLSAASLQIALQSVPGQGSPVLEQTPPVHSSMPVQKSPSFEQGVPSTTFVVEQPPAPSQTFTWHSGAPKQTP